MQIPFVSQALDFATDVLGGIGNVVDDTLTALTGSELLGDLAGVGVNLLTGNVPGAIVEGLETAHDLGRWAGEAAAVAATCPEPPRVPPRDGDGWAVSVDLRPPRVVTSPADLIDFLREPLAFVPALKIRFEPLAGAEPIRGRPASPADRGGLGGAGGLDGVQRGVRGILDDPSLSLEDKVAMLLALLTDDLDEKIEDKMRNLAKVDGGSDEGKQDFQKLQTELQLLMQKRSQMMTLKSNLLNMFHQTSMQVIGNIR